MSSKSIEDLELRMQFVEKSLAYLHLADKEGKTALHRAAEIGDEGMIIQLAKNNANWLCITNEEEETALHLAVKNGHLRATELLLRKYQVYPKSQLLDAKTRTTGSTCLHIAVQMSRLDLVRCLLKFQAKHFIRDNNGKTPVDLASDRKIVELFYHMFESLNIFKKYDPQLPRTFQQFGDDDLMAIANAGHDIKNRTLFVALGIDIAIIGDTLLNPG